MKKILSVLMFVMFVSMLTACKDYQVDIYYCVIGKNGSLEPSSEWETDIALEWAWGVPEKWECILDYDPSVLTFGSSRKASYEIEFIATPNSGYQVKEWTFDGVIVEDNKTNTFTKLFYNYTGVFDYLITVEFEQLPKESVHKSNLIEHGSCSNAHNHVENEQHEHNHNTYRTMACMGELSLYPPYDTYCGLCGQLMTGGGIFFSITLPNGKTYISDEMFSYDMILHLTEDIGISYSYSDYISYISNTNNDSHSNNPPYYLPSRYNELDEFLN